MAFPNGEGGRRGIVRGRRGGEDWRRDRREEGKKGKGERKERG